MEANNLMWFYSFVTGSKVIIVILPPGHSCQGLLCLYTHQFDQSDGNPALGWTVLSRMTKSGSNFPGSRRFPLRRDNYFHHIARPLSLLQLLTHVHLMKVKGRLSWNISFLEKIPVFLQHQHVPQPGARSAFPVLSCVNNATILKEWDKTLGG